MSSFELSTFKKTCNLLMRWRILFHGRHGQWVRGFEYGRGNGQAITDGVPQNTSGHRVWGLQGNGEMPSANHTY